MGIMDRDYMRRRGGGSANPIVAWWRRSSIAEILGTGLLLLTLASAALWFVRDLGLSGGSREGTLRVNVNTATIEELEAVPGIGPALAASIIGGRPYATVDDLERVKGIGPATVEGIRPYVKTSGDNDRLR